MIKRAIHIFPQFENMALIHHLREKYDPLYSFIPPHITLVFPFESHLSTEVLKEHIKSAVSDIKPFSITLQGITGTPEYDLFLNVKQGNDPIIQLHDQLYTDVLSPYLNRKLSYLPHLTVGKLNNQKDFETALMETAVFTESFSTVVKEISVEIIDECDFSHIDFNIHL